MVVFDLNDCNDIVDLDDDDDPIDLNEYQNVTDNGSANEEGENESTEFLDDLLGVSVKSADEAYQLYNRYAFRIGFSVRKGKQRYRADRERISMKTYFCSKAGKKQNIPKVNKCYAKLDSRTDCKALIQFSIDANSGIWTVSRHVKEHNHDLCPPSSSYRLRSHRAMTKNHLGYLRDLKRSGIAVADGIRLLNKQSGGPEFVGFTERDAYNNLACDNLKKLDGSDSSALIEIFRKRQLNEEDFFFYFEVDSDARLCSFFWRDGKMKIDYDLFGDLLVHDTTYRTNRYDMICGPFVGMNHHCANVMFGCGFLMNERTESFVWLFSAFLRSMGGKHPQTIMTDQSAAMAAAISDVFPLSRHRLCIWHIRENSKKNIKSLRSIKGFIDMFNFLLKCTDTEAEFEFYWDRMVNEYGCKGNTWLAKLYSLREKWCPAFSKDFFSGGILSSQRSETTNNSVSRRLFKTAGLCDFYNSFVDVVAEWRSRENGEDIRCLQGQVAMAIDHVKILQHAREIYTIEMYCLFETQFLKGAACHQHFLRSDNISSTYHVWRPELDIFRHEVVFNHQEMLIHCTCKLYSEVGILCCHCLRILDVHCVQNVPKNYINKRWTKGIVQQRYIDIPLCSSTNDASLAASIWRIQMVRNFNSLISASEHNNEARRHLEEAFDVVRRVIVDDVGHIYFNDYDLMPTDEKIQNPSRRRVKGDRNRRPKSVIEKKCKQAKGCRKDAQRVALQTKIAVQNAARDSISEVVGSGCYIAHASSGSSSFLNVIPNSGASHTFSSL